MTSPPNASSASSRSDAKNMIGALTEQLLAGILHLQLHAAFELARAQFQHGDAVAVVRVHVRLDLEDEAGDFLFRRVDDGVDARPCSALTVFGDGAKRADRRQQLIDAVVAQRRAEQNRRHVAFQEALLFEGREAALDQFGGILQFAQFRSASR